jgi:hypothetical protein
MLLEEVTMLLRKESFPALLWMAVLITVLLAPLVGLPDSGKGGESENPAPSQGNWSSLWEGDGVSSPASEGWWLRPWGTTSIYSAFSDGETVAVVDDPDPGDGAWMQKWVDLEPPFEFAARGRYDPLTARTGSVTIPWMFTGCHRMYAKVYPTVLQIGGAQPFDVPAVQGEWYNLTFDVKAPLDVDVYNNGLFIGNVEMNPRDRLSFDSPDYKPGVASIVTPVPTAKGMVDYIRTTMEPIQEVGPKVCDRTPPLVLNLTFDDGIKTPSNDLFISEGVTTLWLNATIDDRTTGDSSVWSSNFTEGASNWPGTSMSATDFQFDSSVEDVSATLDVSGLGVGNYTYCVYGRDYYGNWNPMGSCGVLWIGYPQPPEIRGLVFDDGSQVPARYLETSLAPGAVVWINATVDDTLTGGSDILSANFTTDPQAWPGLDMTPIDSTFDSPIEDVTATVDVMTLGVGNHSFCVYGVDIIGKANTTGLCGSLNVTFYPPGSNAEPLPQYWWNVQPNLQVTVGPGSHSVASVDLFCNQSTDNATWSGWVFCDRDLSPPWSFASPFGLGDGHYSHYSIARDIHGFEETAPGLADTSAGYDATPPSSSVLLDGAYWRTTNFFDTVASANDALSGVWNVTFFLRFSEDNSTWGDWTPLSTDSAPPFTASILVLDGDGYYELKSKAYDLAGNAEMDTGADVRIAIDTTPPDTQALPIVPYNRTGLPVVVDADGEDILSGLLSIELLYRYSENNVSWFTWESLGQIFGPPYQWEFHAPDGEGYYEFCSQGRDVLGNTEAVPISADSRLAYFESAPPPDGPEGTRHDNWKPYLALIFTIVILVVASVLLSRRGVFSGQRSKMLLAMALLFSVLEIITGAASMVISVLAIPPVLGVGTVIDISVLALALAIMLFLGLTKEVTMDRAERLEPPSQYD